ncbi:MAG: hypothetical protein B6V02_02575 [Thermoprotei archaeon ex4572_64]|nr:MAG: hypothetical protein B6V02_02575 [Thermoprotei archaeon ex4572_64]
MSRPVCPALRRTETGFICEYTGKPVNPFAWYCLLDYYTCPIYVAQVKEGKRVEAKAEIKPIEIEEKPEEKRIEVEEVEEKAVEKILEKRELLELPEPEDAIIEHVSQMLSKFESGVKNLDSKWRDYEDSVNSVRYDWEKSKAVLSQYLTILERMISRFNIDLKEVELRRNSGILDESTYLKLKDDLNRKLEKLSVKYSELKSKFSEIDNVIYQHVKRVIITTPTPEVSRLRISLARLEDMYREGRVSKEVYIKLKSELERLLGGST